MYLFATWQQIVAQTKAASKGRRICCVVDSCGSSVLHTAMFFGWTINPWDSGGTVEVDRFEIESHKKGAGGVFSNKALGILNYASRLEQWEESVGMERSIGMLIFQAVWYSVEAARDPPTPSLSSVTQIFGPHGEHKTLGQAIPRMGCIPNAIRAAAAATTCCCHWVRRFPKWPEDLVPLAEWLFFFVVAWNHIFDRLNSCRINGNDGHFHRAPVCDSIVVVCCSWWTIFWKKGFVLLEFKPLLNSVVVTLAQQDNLRWLNGVYHQVVL